MSSEFQPTAVLEHSPAIDYEMVSRKREQLIKTEFQPGGVWNQSSQEHLAFDVSLYDKNTSFEAIRNDALGLITEKVSAESEVADDVTKVRMQLTPPGHRYVQVNGLLEDLMVSPENLDSKKDVLEGITAWRNGVDLAAMTEVKKQFFGAKPGEMLFWYSGMAEDWEDPLVKCYNGAYGYLYAGRVELVELKKDIFIPGLGTVEQTENRKELFVQDFKMDLDRNASNLFLENAATSLHHTGSELDEQPLYESMTTVAKVDAEEAEEWDNEKIWLSLAEAKRQAESSPDIFGLPVEVILGLQDPELHDKLREGAASEVANWLMVEKEKGTDDFRIQSQVRQRFVDATKNQLSNLRKYDFAKDYVSGSGATWGGDDVSKYISGYSNSSVSSGDSCGGWGGSESTQGSYGGLGVGLRYSKRNGFNLEVRFQPIKCSGCGEINYCNFSYCYKEGCGTRLRDFPDPPN
jgi:hypothetical protein